MARSKTDATNTTQRYHKLGGGNRDVIRTRRRFLITSVHGLRARGDGIREVVVPVPPHDREWGVPVPDDRKHFEFLVLEAAQAGLSWTIVLKKREGYRRAFDELDPEKVAPYSIRRVEKLVLNPEIIRNRLKIEAAVRNARTFLKIQEEFGSFDSYCWRFVDGRPKVNRWKIMRQIPATSPESDAFSKDLKRRGFSFVGSTVVYAHMQAVGMVNDHLIDCFRYREISTDRSSCKSASRHLFWRLEVDNGRTLP